MIKNILIDLDDTLIANHYSYYAPQLDAAKMIVIDLEEYSPSPIDIIEMATEFQIQNINELGYISEICFPNSFIKVYRNICEKIGRPANNAIESAIGVIAAKYLLKQYKLYPGVKETLSAIKQNKILVTRGSEKIQDYKIDNAGIREFFNHIEIVKLKTKDTYLKLIDKYQLNPNETIMVGDSIRNDIVPAIEAGLMVVHIESGIINWDWENKLGLLKELHKAYEFPVIKTFSEIVGYLD